MAEGIPATDEYQRFVTMMAQLPPKFFDELAGKDLRDHPTPYTKAKETLMGRFSMNEFDRVERLLARVEAGDKSPGEILQEMRMLKVDGADNDPRTVPGRSPGASRTTDSAGTITNLVLTHRGAALGAFLATSLPQTAISNVPCPWVTSATTHSDPRQINRIIVADRQYRTSFLIDTGSDVCALPRPHSFDQRTQAGRVVTLLRLEAANNSHIAVYRAVTYTVDLGLRRNFEYEFIYADVAQPIIGLDLLKKYKLLVDPANDCLIDSETGLRSRRTPASGRTTCSSVKLASDEYDQILSEF